MTSPPSSSAARPWRRSCGRQPRSKPRTSRPSRWSAASPSPTALEVLRARDDATYDAADPHTITISGAEVQFQDVEPVDDADVSHLDDKDLLYVAAHAHALAAATPVRLLAAETRTEATVPVATTGALLATKLHAYLGRRRVAGPDKRPGDLWDIYNLLLHLGGDAAAEEISYDAVAFLDALGER